MEIAVIGISHKEAPVSIRGDVAFTASMKKEATQYFFEQGMSEFMMISTCNRSEIYIASKNMIKDIEIVKAYLVDKAGSKIRPYLFVRKYEVGIQHIYQVACGLDSLVLGEDEILGQMKRALDTGTELGSCKKYMSKVVREAITFSKKIRTEFKMSENQLSVAAIGVKYLKEQLGGLKNKKVLLIGTGAMGQLIFKYLQEENITSLYTCNRTYHRERVEYFIDHSVNVVAYPERYDYMSDMDIVISATASPHTIIKANKLKPFSQTITFLDMAVPRDVDADIDELENTQVITLDTLSAIAEAHRNLRIDIAQQINRLILEEVKALELWILRSKVDGVIKEFHKKQYRIITNNVMDLKKLNLKEEDEAIIEEIIKRSTWQMIKEPVQRLKALKEGEEIDHYKMIIEKLFDFERRDN